MSELSDFARGLAARRKRGPKLCVVCGAQFVGFTKSSFCSNACKQQDYRNRNQAQLNAKRRSRYQDQKSAD